MALPSKSLYHYSLRSYSFPLEVLPSNSHQYNNQQDIYKKKKRTNKKCTFSSVSEYLERYAFMSFFPHPYSIEYSNQTINH